MAKPLNGYQSRSRRTLKKALRKKKSVAKSTSRRKRLPAPKPKKDRGMDDPKEQFAAAKQLLRQLIQSPEVSRQFDPQLRTSSRMIYTKGVTMDAENILAHSVVMVKKELLTSVVAFNLIAQFRRQAAKLVSIQPRRLSFKGVWLSFRDHLLLKEPENLSEWQDLYTAALISASNRELPHRSKPRSYPRRAHPRRPKSTKFMKTQPQADEQKEDEKYKLPPPIVRK